MKTSVDIFNALNESFNKENRTKKIVYMEGDKVTEKNILSRRRDRACKESSTAEYWDAKEIDRKGFVSLLKSNTEKNRYYITLDANKVKNISADSDEEAKKIFKEYLKKESAKLEEAEEVFSGQTFEKNIPFGMRFKSYEILDNNKLYWVTQDLFTREDLDKFCKAIRDNTNFDGAYVTVRDLSYAYDPEEDINERHVVVEIDKDGNVIDTEGFIRALRGDGFSSEELGFNDSDITIKEETEESKEEDKLEEDTIVKIPAVEEEKDYIINDVTIIEQSGEGDIQAPDIDGLLTLVDESLKEKYGDDWGKIHILSSRIDESSSFALIDITTKEIIKEFDNMGIKDAAIGRNFILENNNGLINFKVNKLNGHTIYSKSSKDIVNSIKEWIETEYLHESLKEFEELKAIEREKKHKEVLEAYIEGRPELKAEIDNIKMFIELAKQTKSEEMNKMIQDRIYGFVVELPNNIETTENTLTFDGLDSSVEILFGKEWLKEPTEDNKVVGVIKESYEQFNIGEIEVVFNPNTYETLYSIPTADVQDKKINLTKVPSVDTPYDTDTIIKQYVETRFGVIPTEEEEVEVEDDLELKNNGDEVNNIEVEEKGPEIEPDNHEEELEEVDLPEEPTEEEIIDTEVEDIDDIDDTDEEESETGELSFMKIRPKNKTSVEDIRTHILDEDTPKANYIVVGEIDLDNEEFDDLINNLNKDREWLLDVQPIDRKNYSFNVIKVNNSNSDFSVLIDPLGYNYPRYVSILD